MVASRRSSSADDMPSIEFQNQWQDQKSDYSAARNSRHMRRRSGIPAGGASGDYHIRSDADYLRMMELARDMVRNDAILGPAIQKLLTNVIQDGFMPDPQTGSEDVDAILRDSWQQWSTDPDQCDLAGQMSFVDMEYQVLGSQVTDGDIFGLPYQDGQIELAEAHRCRTPSNTKRNVVHGVLLDPQTRRRRQYWFTKEQVDPSRSVSRVGDMRQIDAYDELGDPQVFHVFDPRRVTQSRGVTITAPIFPTLGMFEDINFAKMVQQQAVSSYALLIERNGKGFVPGKPNTGEKVDESDPTGERLIKQIGPGMIFRPRAGEKVTGFSPNVPNEEFFNHVRLMLQICGIHLKLPLVLLLMDATETNFSGWRGAVDQARMEFRRVQMWLVRKWHRKVFRWKVNQWLAENPDLRKAVQAGGTKVKVHKHRWNVPRWPYIQPLQDAQAHALRLQTRQTSPRRGSSELGIEYEELVEEIITDNERMILRALESRDVILEKYPGANVDWHELLHVPSSDLLTGKLMEVKVDANA